MLSKKVIAERFICLKLIIMFFSLSQLHTFILKLFFFHLQCTLTACFDECSGIIWRAINPQKSGTSWISHAARKHLHLLWFTFSTLPANTEGFLWEDFFYITWHGFIPHYKSVTMEVEGGKKAGRGVVNFGLCLWLNRKWRSACK